MVAWLGGSPVASNEPCAGRGYPVGQHAKKSLFVGTAKAGSSPQLAEDSEPVNVCNQATVDAKCKPGQQNRSIVFFFHLSMRPIRNLECLSCWFQVHPKTRDTAKIAEK